MKNKVLFILILTIALCVCVSAQNPPPVPNSGQNPPPDANSAQNPSSAANSPAPDAGLMPTPAPKAFDPNRIVAKIDGEPIYAHEVEEKVNGFTDKFREVSPNMQFSDERLTQMRKEFLDRLVKERIMQKAASSEKIEVAETEIDERISQFQKIFGEGPEAQQRFLGGIKDMKKFRAEVSKQIVVDKFVENRTKGMIVISDEDIKKFYAENTDKFAVPESIKARQILLKLPPKESADFAEKQAIALKKAETVAKDVQSGQKFEDLAKTISEDSKSAPSGGDMGIVLRGKLQKDIEDVLFSMNSGEVSKPLETPTGIYVFQLLEKTAARTMSMEESNDKIRKGLESRKKEEAREKLYNELKTKTKVEIIP